jgi:hypothetical protein
MEQIFGVEITWLKADKKERLEWMAKLANEYHPPQDKIWINGTRWIDGLPREQQSIDFDKYDDVVVIFYHKPNANYAENMIKFIQENCPVTPVKMEMKTIEVDS